MNPILHGRVHATDGPVFGGQVILSRPVVGDEYVMYLTRNAQLDYVVNVVDVTMGPPPAYSHVAGPDEMRLLGISGQTVFFERGDSVGNAYAGSVWDPGNVSLFQPADQGCTSYRGLKSSRAGIHLVQGIDCPEGPSVLYAFVSAGDGSYTALYVDELAASGSQYDVLDDNIVYTRPGGEVIWTRADLAEYGAFRSELEPNDELSNATPFEVGKRGVGVLVSGCCNPWTEDDYWSVTLEAGVSYSILSGTYAPGALCYVYEKKEIEVFDENEVSLANNMVNYLNSSGFPAQPGQPAVVNFCGRIESFVAPYSGTFYIRVRGGDTTWYDQPYVILVSD